jgi:hypothetical protein
MDILWLGWGLEEYYISLAVLRHFGGVQKKTTATRGGEADTGLVWHGGRLYVPGLVRVLRDLLSRALFCAGDGVVGCLNARLW